MRIAKSETKIDTRSQQKYEMSTRRLRGHFLRSLIFFSHNRICDIRVCVDFATHR